MGSSGGGSSGDYMIIHDSVVSLFGHSLVIPDHAKQLIFAMLIGLVIGFERAMRRKMASLTTFAFICVGSCLFTILSVEAVKGSANFDITRIAAQIVTGIGFVGGGVIFKSEASVHGVTTAALVWLTAAIGMAIGFNHPDMALWGFITWAISLGIGRSSHRLIGVGRAKKISQIRSSKPDGSEVA